MSKSNKKVFILDSQLIFTRLVCRKLNTKYDSYKHHLSFFNLDTLEIRKIKYDLIVIFEIIHNLIDLQFDNFFSINPSLKLYQFRRHKLQLNKPIPPATYHLPSDIVMSKSLVCVSERCSL